MAAVPDQEGTSVVNANSTVTVVVEGSGEGIVAHVGLHALGGFGDRLGLGDSLSAHIPVTGERFRCTIGARCSLRRC